MLSHLHFTVRMSDMQSSGMRKKRYDINSFYTSILIFMPIMKGAYNMKNTICRLTSLLMICALVISSFALNINAAGVQHSAYHFDPRTTPISGYTGYSECNFAGNYYSDGNSNNNAIIHAEAKGGPKDDFFTCVYLRILNSGGGLRYNDSQLQNSRIVPEHLQIPSNQISNNTTGFGEFGCYPLDNNNEPDYSSNDSWHYIYYGYWRNAYYGWDA